MKRISIYTVALFVCYALFTYSCNSGDEKPEATVASAHTKVPDLNQVETDLPEAPGYQTFYSNCVVCHSPRYIQNQPDMPEKSWAAIVNKMQKTFGAPVSDSSAAIIVQYLASVKGVE